MAFSMQELKCQEILLALEESFPQTATLFQAKEETAFQGGKVMPKRVWLNAATQILVTAVQQVLLSHCGLAKQLHSKILGCPLGEYLGGYRTKGP